MAKFLRLRFFSNKHIQMPAYTTSLPLSLPADSRNGYKNYVQEGIYITLSQHITATYLSKYSIEVSCSCDPTNVYNATGI